MAQARRAAMHAQPGPFVWDAGAAGVLAAGAGEGAVVGGDVATGVICNNGGGGHALQDGRLQRSRGSSLRDDADAAVVEGAGGEGGGGGGAVSNQGDGAVAPGALGQDDGGAMHDVEGARVEGASLEASAEVRAGTYDGATCSEELVTPCSGSS